MSCYNFPNEYPYTLFHELNLDWILEKLAESSDYAEKAYKIAQAIENVPDSVEAAKQAAIDASASATEAQEAARESSTGVANAVEKSETALTTSQQALTQVGQISAQSAEALETANDALQRAYNAETDVSMIEDDVEQASADAATAKATATAAQESATTAQATATAAQATATAAQESATSANEKATTALNKANANEQSIAEILAEQGFVFEKVWENAAPSSDFAGQDIALDTTNISMAFVFFIRVGGASSPRYVTAITKIGANNVVNDLILQTSGYAVFNSRTWNFDTNGIGFADCYSQGATSNTRSLANNRLIPHEIWFVK